MLLDHVFPDQNTIASPPEPQQDPGWYVLRYRVLSTWLKDKLDQAPLEIFHRYRLQDAKGSGRGERKEVPVLHGYVFVHAPFHQVKDFANDVNLGMMLDPFREREAQGAAHCEDSEARKYVHIKQKAMKPFMRAVELKSYAIEFFDPNVIDVQKDDLVEFIEGDMKGTKGYLKPGKGRNGGLVIVPLVMHRKSDVDEDDDPHPHLAHFCYSLRAHQNELGIVAFAKGNRHAKDCIINAKPIVDQAFERYKAKAEIDAATHEKLIAFVRRYGRTRLNTSIQTAQHLSLLYRINTILRHHTIGAELREKIAEVVIPELQRRTADALNRGNLPAAKKQQKLLDDIEETDKVFVGQARIYVEKN